MDSNLVIKDDGGSGTLAIGDGGGRKTSAGHRAQHDRCMTTWEGPQGTDALVYSRQASEEARDSKCSF